LARTCFLAKKQCALARSIRIHFWRIPLRILGEIQAKHSGRAFGTPTHWLVQSLLVLYWCVYCTKLEPISKIGNVPRAERVVSPNQIVRSTKAPPRPRSARQPQRKMFLAFRICARSIFSEKGKDIFLWGSAL
jgi:hypothetical protein